MVAITITEEEGVFFATDDSDPPMFCAATSLSQVLDAIRRVAPAQSYPGSETLSDRLRCEAFDAVDWNGKTMKYWDEIRAQCETLKGSDLPRLMFESLVEGFAELMTDAANEIDGLRYRIARLNGVAQASANCDCGFSADVCKTNPCMRKKMATSGLNPDAKYPYCGSLGSAQAAPEPSAVERFQKRIVGMMQAGCTGFHFTSGAKWHSMTIEEKCAAMLEVWDAKLSSTEGQDDRPLSTS